MQGSASLKPDLNQGRKRKSERPRRSSGKAWSCDQERYAIWANSGEAGAALECPCMTMQTNKAARAAEIVPRVIAKNAKAPLLMHSPRVTCDARVEHSFMTVLFSNKGDLMS